MPEEKNQSLYNQPNTWFRNHGLFSDHYLQSRLPEWDDWKIADELSAFRQQLLSLYESKKAILPSLNEAQTEDEFIKPTLDLLGYANSYIVQPHAKKGKQAIRPDYILFPDKAATTEAYQKKKGSYYSKCIGIADAKYWERDLDLSKSNELDTFSNLNPSFQIINYLIGTQQTWGILTNGRLWRLYSLKSYNHLDDYYQVDIVKLLESSEDKLKYFYLFFRKAALLFQADGKSFLDKVFAGSNAYAVELEADIKERAYEVVQLLCQGFGANFPPEQLTPQMLTDIYDGSLILLYRLLFVFYAEARELLPLTTSAEYLNDYSLRKLTDDIAENDQKGFKPSDKTTDSYQYLCKLFTLIDSGDHLNGVPKYNGGLFDPLEHPFLEKYTISDVFLLPAISHLAWVMDKKLVRVVAVDYNTLRERHLGNIYEGLLEFKPRFAANDLVLIKDKSSIKYASAKAYPGKDIKYHKGELYLANDKGERKTTGSYYTPEYIVNYIVDNTIDPLVKEAQSKVRALKPEVNSKITKWQKKKKNSLGLEPAEKYDKAIAKERERLLEPYLSIRVLDPAMGSGHFLARATDFLAEAIATDPSIEPPVEATEETELIYYRRRVVESCIYGVDLNPLAVELAKLTLWLGTMAKSKPLSFLNHHLRTGNSLIGAKIDDLDEIPKKKGKPLDLSRAPVQIGQFQWAFNNHLKVLLESRALIAQIPTETLKDVNEKEKWQKDFEYHVERFRTLADLWVSTYFGNDISWHDYNTLMESLQAPDPEWEMFIHKKHIQKAMAMRKEKHFFHWELEFPEVFFNEQGNRKANAGFDAIVGNPPYELLETRKSDYQPLPGADNKHRYEERVKQFEQERIYFNTTGQYKQALGKKLDYFRLMIERVLNYTHKDGLFGMIVPRTLLADDTATNLRKWLLVENQVLIIQAFPKDPPGCWVFPDAELATCIPIIRRGETTNKLTVYYEHCRYIEDTAIKLDCILDELKMLDSNSLPIPKTTKSELQVATSLYIKKEIIKFGHISPCFIGELNSEYQKVFMKDYDTGTLMLRGRHISRYYIDLSEISEDKRWIDKDAYMKSLSFDMNDKHPSKTIRIVKQGINDIEDPRRIIAALCPNNVFLSDSTDFLTVTDPYNIMYVLAVLNSYLLEWRFRMTSTNNNVNTHEIEALPFRTIRFATPAKEREELIDKGKNLYYDYIQSQNWDKVSAFVSSCLYQNAVGTPDTEHEKSDVVHDLLAFLAEEMTRLNKEKQAKIKAFLNWIEKEIIKGSVENQKNKTKIRNFYEGTFEELLDILKRNGVITGPYPPDKRDNLEHVFTEAVNGINPLIRRIKLTDNLIDQIVYKLYGLTDDEINIVEG